MGLIQMSFLWRRYQLIDYSNPIYVYDFCWKTVLPPEKSSYGLLFKLFDAFTWIFFVLSICLVLAAFTLSDYLFYGDINSCHHFENIIIALATPLKEALPPQWYERTRRQSKYMVIATWLLASVVLSTAYQSDLLSTMATKRFNYQFLNDIKENIFLKKSFKL